jgi:hypothetical protein
MIPYRPRWGAVGGLAVLSALASIMGGTGRNNPMAPVFKPSVVRLRSLRPANIAEWYYQRAKAKRFRRASSPYPYASKYAKGNF